MDRGAQGKRSTNAKQILGLIALLIALTTAGGLTIGGIVLALVIGVPVFLLFSPVLVPLGIVAFLAVSGVSVTVGGALVFFSFIQWVYNYFKGRHPIGSDRLDAARHRLLGSVQKTAEKGREYAGAKA